jgi:hypothetical protein
MLSKNVMANPRHLEKQTWLRFEEEVRKYISVPGSRVVLTGHSLGGGVAEVVSSTLGVDALVFSAPGSRYLQKVFNISSQMAQKYVNIVPEHDPVPRVDQHYGVVQKILCRDKLGRHLLPVHCHGLVRGSCELWRVCGDAPPWRNSTRERNFTVGCGAFVDDNFVGALFPEQPTSFLSELWT